MENSEVLAELRRLNDNLAALHTLIDTVSERHLEATVRTGMAIGWLVAQGLQLTERAAWKAADGALREVTLVEPPLAPGLFGLLRELSLATLADASPGDTGGS